MSCVHGAWSQLTPTLLPREVAGVVMRLMAQQVCHKEGTARQVSSVCRGVLAEISRCMGSCRRAVYRAWLQARCRCGRPERVVERSSAVWNHDTVIEVVWLEQLYKGLYDTMRFWLQDGSPATVDEAAKRVVRDGLVVFS